MYTWVNLSLKRIYDMRKLTIGVAVWLALFSCKDPGEISVVNELPNAELNNVRWGNITLDNQLLPGEQSPVWELDRFNSDLPESHAVSFLLTVNSATVFLETTEVFRVDLDDKVVIVIDSATEVRNSILD